MKITNDEVQQQSHGEGINTCSFDVITSATSVLFSACQNTIYFKTELQPDMVS